MLRSEVLPAPFGPMIEISSPCDRERDILDRAHAAELLRDARDSELHLVREAASCRLIHRTRCRLHFLTLPPARICVPLMAGMMQTQVRYGNGLYD